MLLYHFPELSQTFVLDQISGLEAAGFEVRVFATHLATSGLLHAKGKAQAKSASIADRHPLVRLSRLPFFSESQRKRIHSGVSNRLIRKAASQYDILLCHFGPNGLRAVKSALKLNRFAPIWTIFHGFDLSSYLKMHGRSVYDPLFARGDRFLPISELWASELVDLGCPPDRIQLLRMGVDCEAISFNFMERSPNQPFRIMSVGRLTEKKGTEYSLRALAELKRAHPSVTWSFDIVGEGPLWSKLHDLAKGLGIGDLVRFHGARSSADVLDLLRQAHVFLLPSVTSADGDMEGVPVALMEAMAAGIPVVSTLHSGIPELIDHGRSGFLAPERDFRQLAHHLETLIRDDEMRRSIATAARAKVVEDFNQRRINAELAESISAAL